MENGFPNSHKIGEEQRGLVRSCVGNLYVLQQIVEMQIATDQKVHIAFINLKNKDVINIRKKRE